MNTHHLRVRFEKNTREQISIAFRAAPETGQSKEHARGLRSSCAFSILMEPEFDEALENVRWVLELRATFLLIIITEDGRRDWIASRLYASLSDSEWQCVLVIAPEQIFAAMRWIEEKETEHGC